MTALKHKYERLPARPGVYEFRDGKGTLLYIGKAKNLRKRVASYFQRTTSLEPAKQLMVAKITDIDYTITDTEQEALLLESTRIKDHQPPYNIVLRDDKSFLYIKVALGEEFPSVSAVRRVRADRGRYFGPYTSAASVHATLKLLKRVFRYRTCTPHQGKPCFDVHLGRCLGPCADLITPTAYRRKVVTPILDFLTGKTREVVARLRTEMEAAARRQVYEDAARARDQLQAIERISARQKVVSTRRERFDAIGVALDRDWAAIALLRVREGTLLGQQTFLLHRHSESTPVDVVGAFLEQYLPSAPDAPKDVLVGVDLPDVAALARLLHVRLHRPERGTKRQLLTLAATNAAEYLERRRAEWLLDGNRSRRALEGLQEALGLQKLPKRIEAFDISNIQGTHAVGSMVVFVNGMPQRDAYRKFTIRTVLRADDPGMMVEVLGRRLAHPEWSTPDLVILDGGKGQLSQVLERTDIRKRRIPIVALAKQEEELFLPGRTQSVRLPRNAEGLFLVQRIRDEAHRFAITFYRTRHRAASTASALDRVPSVGPKSRRQLLRTFGSVESVRQASEEDLAAVVGAARAQKIKEHLA